MPSSPAVTPKRYTAQKDTIQVVATATAGTGLVVTYYHIYNLDSTVNYLHVYDAVTATPGTTTPTYTLAVPASGWLDLSDSDGIWRFGTGLVIAATTALAGTGTPTNGLLVNLGLRT